MWKIEHKCNPGQPESQPYAIQAVISSEGPMTRVVCVDGCREEFMVVGDEMFQEARRMQDGSSAASAMPPGFVIAKSRVPG